MFWYSPNKVTIFFQDVGLWLEEINLGSYRQVFEENGVNGEYLESLSMFTTEQILRFIRRCHMKWGDFITLCKELRRIKGLYNYCSSLAFHIKDSIYITHFFYVLPYNSCAPPNVLIFSIGSTWLCNNVRSSLLKRNFRFLSLMHLFGIYKSSQNTSICSGKSSLLGCSVM